MRKVKLYDYQKSAIERMHNGCILCGGVGSGKTITSLGYFAEKVELKDLYVITTARKRDGLEWEEDMAYFGLSPNPEFNTVGNKVVIDSWNNIKKYTGVKNAFFIFDEQRVVGYGAWTKAFLKITKQNEWILLSATPGDDWKDYIPVFIANGFYKNKTEFEREHVVYSPRVTFPKIDRYLNTGRLARLRRKVLVEMDFIRPTVSHNEDIHTSYDRFAWHDIYIKRWNPYTDSPIMNASEFCQILRKLVNSDETRKDAVLEIFKDHPKIIVFYNYDYELDILKSLPYGDDVEVAELNGHKHQPVPEGKSWVYLVQYNCGSEAWNCVKTDTIIFYSLNYSYRMMTQAKGRIDRLNTPFTDLYYYYLKSRSPIDLAISRVLAKKKKFNESDFVKW